MPPALSTVKAYIRQAEQELQVRQVPLRRQFNLWRLGAGGKKVRIDPAALDYKEDSTTCVRVPWPGKFCAGHAHCAGLDKSGCKAQRNAVKKAYRTKEAELKRQVQGAREIHEESQQTTDAAKRERLQQQVSALKAEVRQQYQAAKTALDQKCSWTSDTPAGQYLSSSLPQAQPFGPCARKTAERPYLRYHRKDAATAAKIRHPPGRR